MSNRYVKEALTKQPRLIKHFMQVIQSQRLSHAYLFSGEAGTGKLAVALTIAMRLFCLEVRDHLPCGHCNECMRITKGEHPDVLVIRPQGRRIRIHQIRFLRTEFSKSAVEGHLKIFIIDQAEAMTTSAANSLLKFIEEPAGQVICFLLTDDQTLILPTIASRTQIVKFPSLSSAFFDQELKASHLAPGQYNLLATMTNDLHTVQRWNQNGWFGHLQQAVERWFQYLVQSNDLAFPFVQMRMLPLVNSYEEARIALDMLIQIWCDVMKCKFKVVKESETKFPQVYHEVRKMASRISVNYLLDNINLVLSTDPLLAQNISFQEVMESVTLRILVKLRS